MESEEKEIVSTLGRKCSVIKHVITLEHCNVNIHLKLKLCNLAEHYKILALCTVIFFL